jgi:glycosyltransferase involved in cell wall biosynthesis
MTLTYAVVTPVRDEKENLERLASSMLAQSVTPEQWIVVDNGSVDGTLELAGRLAAEYAWIEAMTAEQDDFAQAGPPSISATGNGARRS